MTLLSGVDALARLLVVRTQVDVRDGLTTATMVSGYPGSPLGTFDLAVDRLGPELAAHRIVHRPGVNEELALATVWGSQMGAAVGYDGIDGVAGAWYGKGPGLDRSGDSLKHANAMGVGPSGGAVLFCGDDPAAKSSTLTCDSQPTFADACVPVLYPGNQQELLDLGVHAFRLSRYAGCWVGMKVVTAVADGLGTVDASVDRQHPVDPETGWQHRPLATLGPHAVPDQEVLVVERRLAAAQEYVRANRLDRMVGTGTRLGVVCAGKTYYDVVQAFADAGLDPDDVGVRILKPALTYPVVPETVREFAASVDEILVVEEKRPFVEVQLRALLHEAGIGVPVRGKRDAGGRPLVSSVGELDPSAVAAVLGRVLPGFVAPPVRRTLALLDLPGRAPGYCSGCPHNRSTVAPADALVGGGVGCHGILYFEARNAALRTLPPTPMGAEGVPWIGLAPFVAEQHLIQNLGDGTLSHSGTLAIRSCVAAGVNITFKILYNSAVAMTGGQDVTGLPDVPSLTRALHAEGVQRIVVCAEEPSRYGRKAQWAPGVRVLGRDRLTASQDELRKVAGVTVLIYDQRCAAESRRLRKQGVLPQPQQRVVINEAVCEGCGDCAAKSNCLSVLPHDTEFGVKRRVHDPSCNSDYTCLEGDCPAFVTITPRNGSRKRPSRKRPALPNGELPTPVVALPSQRFSVYVTGIGGTGVVTACRILATAARDAGLDVSGLDQTGLSQKAGAVVSHLHLTPPGADPGAATTSEGGADLYLSGDLLQAAAPRHLAKVRAGHTVAVLEQDLTPTATMLQGGPAAPDTDRLRRAVAEQVGEGSVHVVDARRVAERVFADHLPANVVLLGVAFQRGALPLPLDALDRALGRRGADNRRAFEWGRWLAHDPAAVAAALPADDRTMFDPSPAALATAADLVEEVPPGLRDLLIRRTAQVIDYQDVRRAQRYLDLVRPVAAHDRGELTRAVAESWFKLLTYKDEYEVARLHLAADHDRAAADLGIDGDYRVTYHLHPPVLRRLGMARKLPLGAPYALAFRLLRRLRRLRGTRWDPFGLDPDRRTERALLVEYADLIAEITRPDTPLDYRTRVALASSALSIKGYGPVKDRAVAAWRAEVAALRDQTP
ncbi:indolepyruvate ferredoxin oxidoreductase family protein [Cryptosporangium aurantiacum]|uniref:Indolepyruvate ferredoxin oxidoreductase n=1 Tax=Cryptosporangium aurantiacum TaxID=134849 RepID=A0A1M7KIB8_9ACTN|nr:indolepyruvate ferredoxin oxidoreductase family protein [Cryptosporangium aurantiacum]SHM65082.1 indolepyruvate ferredoxin oxidoreductase [Cryptosporangium aurantiacum]